ncbi:hypothetical protein [Gordonia sp. N1V]|uniref:hypothetical protein n=1 Tax=Gordonia sp. N1V TaxID=3034163 RepID=UPI0023E2A1C7|nr:hypothetical protein [Gordonia sp. N1V]MDF3282892.1 hypothetical protein [Gordonia sp. N1V]
MNATAAQQITPDGITPDGITPDGIYHQVWQATGFDATCMPEPGASIVVAGAVGSAVDDLLAACAAVAPDLPISATGSGLGTGGIGSGLMVLGPSSDLDADEVELFVRLRTEVGTVALVCTGIDAFWEWPRRLRAQRAVLDPAEELPVFAVSAAAALAGAVDESGLTDLVAWMHEGQMRPIEQRIEQARLAACVTALDRRIRDDHLSSAATAHTDPDDLMRRRRTLVATRDRGRTDRLAAVRAGVAGVRTATIADAQTGFRALLAAANRRCAHATPGELATHLTWLDAEIAQVNARVDAVLDDRLEAVGATALLGVDGDEPGRGAGPAGQAVSAVRRAPPTGRRGAEDALMVLIGASTGVGVGRLIVSPMETVHTLQWISMPLTLVIGVAVAFWVIRIRRAAARRTDLRSFSAEVLTEARGRLEQRIASRSTEAESRLAGQITRHHERRVRQVAADVADIDASLRRLRAGPPSGATAESARLAGLRHTVAARLAEASRAKVWAETTTAPAVTRSEQ